MKKHSTLKVFQRITLNKISRFIFSFVASNFFFLSIVSALPAPGILGSWKAETLLPGRGVQFQLSFNFKNNSTTMLVECLFQDGAQLSAQVESQTNYSANDIYILETRKNSTQDGIRFCQASFQPSRWSAFFDGTGKLVLFAPEPLQTRLVLVRQSLPE